MIPLFLSLAALSLQEIDRSIYEDIRYGWPDPGLRFASSFVSEVAGPPAQAGLAGLLYLRGNSSQQQAGRLAGVSLISAIAASTGVGALVRRPRPESESSPWWSSSFPSTHATCYYAATAVYSRKWPELAPFAAIGGVLMCFSRVHQGKHYPVDVIAGALLGYGCAAVVLALEKPLTPVLDRLVPVRGAAVCAGPGRVGIEWGI
ncbi:MAG: phosphatase PAP2 family protein [candidate division WOR-3 bacterium]